MAAYVTAVVLLPRLVLFDPVRHLAKLALTFVAGPMNTAVAEVP
jgi:hypothetical protein